SRCSITDDAATLLLGTSVLSSLKGGGLRQAEDPVNPLQPRSVVKNPSICKGETPRSIVYAPQEVAGHARSAKTEGQHVSDGDHRGACAQRPFPATAGCRGGLFVHSRARSPFVL